MAENSNIAWTDNTFNPWIGCMKVSAGCDHCYAEAYDNRFNGGHWGAGAERRRTSASNWSKPKKWNRDAAKAGVRPWVFCASLADVFDNEAPLGARGDLWQLIYECQNLNWQIVTKRIGNADKMLPTNFGRDFPHVGIISTVVTQAECNRDLQKLLTAKERHGIAWIGLSIEPQLERVIPSTADGLDWIISGGESDQGGAPAREYRSAWALELIEWGAARGVAIFEKQLGSHWARENGARDRAGADPLEWPADLRVRQMPFGVPTIISTIAA
jgi:protein gp37